MKNEFNLHQEKNEYHYGIENHYRSGNSSHRIASRGKAGRRLWDSPD